MMIAARGRGRVLGEAEGAGAAGGVRGGSSSWGLEGGGAATIEIATGLSAGQRPPGTLNWERGRQRRDSCTL